MRAWWWKKQALDGSFAGRPPAEVLARTGWARSVGGAGPYLTLFARAGTRRPEVDEALARIEIHELPAARGCTYVVPASDFALALRAGQPFAGAEMKTAAKLGVTEAEIAKLSEAVLRALEQGPLDPDELKEAAGPAARSLGPEGKKKGISNTLPIALGELQSRGEIRRIPVNGRLDQQRYKYARWGARCDLPLETAHTELARRFFAWIGPATLAEFQWFSGLSAKAARAAIEPLRLESAAEDRLLLPEDRDEFERFTPPRDPQYALVSSLDGISHLRRNIKGLLAEEDRAWEVFADTSIKPLGGLADLPSHAILDRGRVIGLWEYDPETASIAWWTFRPADAELKQAIARTEEFVRTDLGDARSFSLDSPKSRAPRIAALRAAVK